MLFNALIQALENGEKNIGNLFGETCEKMSTMKCCHNDPHLNGRMGCATYYDSLFDDLMI